MKMGNRRGLTLVELLISVGLLAMLSAVASLVSMFVINRQSALQGDVLPIAEANIALEAIVQRVMRAPPMYINGQNVSYLIYDNGTRLDFLSEDGSRTEEVRQLGSSLLFTSNAGSAPTETLVTGVQSVNFSQDWGSRLAILLTVRTNQTLTGMWFDPFASLAWADTFPTDTTLRTSVSSRNTPTVKNRIN